MAPAKQPITHVLILLPLANLPYRSVISPFIDPITKSKIQMVPTEQLKTKLLALVRTGTLPNHTPEINASVLNANHNATLILTLNLSHT